MNDPLGEDPLGSDPIGDHLEFEVKEEPFEFCDDSICWVSEGVTVIENGGEEYAEKLEPGEVLEDVPMHSEYGISNQHVTSEVSKHIKEEGNGLKNVCGRSLYGAVRLPADSDCEENSPDNPREFVAPIDDVDSAEMKCNDEPDCMPDTEQEKDVAGPSYNGRGKKKRKKGSDKLQCVWMSVAKEDITGLSVPSFQGEILPAKAAVPGNTKMMKCCIVALTDKSRDTTEKEIIKEKEEKVSHLGRKKIKLQLKKEIEIKYKEDLERQLAKHKWNIKKMQMIIDEERAKMAKVQNALINLKRRLKRHELKELKLTALKTNCKEEDIQEETLKKRKWEMEIKKQIGAVEAINRKRKTIESRKGMRRKKRFSELNKREEVKVELVFREEKEIEIMKKVKKGLVQTKEIEKGEQIKGMGHKKNLSELMKIEELKDEKNITYLEEAEIEKIRVEMEENNRKPQMQIATSHMLWNVLSHIKTEQYLRGNVNNSKVDLETTNIHFPLHPQNKPNAFDVPRLVKEFMLREDVSRACTPSSNQPEDSPGHRYRLHYLSILYKQFVAEHGMLCNYKTFVNFVPSNVMKPSPCFWKTCICLPCINPDIKFEKLSSIGTLQMNGLELGDILHDAEKEKALMSQLSRMRDSRELLTYDFWERNCNGTINSKRRKVSEPVGIIVAKFIEELSILKSHIQRTFCQLDASKMARERAMHSTDEVTLHLDCSPLPIYHRAGPESGPADIATILTILTGCLWNHGGVQAVVSMSDSKDYTSAAVWAGLEKILQSIVKAGKSKITVISDSPTNRYRNKSNFYYMSDFAQVYGVCLRWVFLEASHGIGNAGNVRSEFDHVIRDRISCNPTVRVRNSSDVLNKVQGHTLSAVHIYTDQDVQKYKCSLPKLRVVHGTQKFHEIIVLPEDFWVRDVVSKDSFRKLSF